MKYPSLLIGAVISILLCLCGCDLGELEDPGPQLDSSVDGKSIGYTLGESFSLELDVCADAGYRWYIVFSDSAVVRLDSAKYRPKSGDWNQVGGMTVETFYFHATTRGRCTVNMNERQGWMPSVPPINTVQFDVVVRM
jgi:predicted secreted protein